MGLRKALAYSKKKVRPYTRKSKKKGKAYIKTVPGMKIVKFNMGNQEAFREGKHNYSVSLVAGERVQIRDNALEACRMALNRLLDKHIQGEYYFNIKVYPHHILRENKTAAGAGADRLSSGMKHSFGVTIGRAAIVSPGKEIFFISCSDEKIARFVRKALAGMKAKIPSKTKITFEKIK